MKSTAWLCTSVVLELWFFFHFLGNSGGTFLWSRYLGLLGTTLHQALWVQLILLFWSSNLHLSKQKYFPCVWVRTDLCDSGTCGIHGWDSLILWWSWSPFVFLCLSCWSQDRTLIKPSESRTMQNEKKLRDSTKNLETLAICIFPFITYIFLEAKRAYDCWFWYLAQSSPSSVTHKLMFCDAGQWFYLGYGLKLLLTGLGSAKHFGVLTPWKSIGLSKREGRNRGIMPFPLCLSVMAGCSISHDVLHPSPSFLPQNDRIQSGKLIEFT